MPFLHLCYCRKSCLRLAREGGCDCRLCCSTLSLRTTFYIYGTCPDEKSRRFLLMETNFKRYSTETTPH